jgi:hypothetical protein
MMKEAPMRYLFLFLAVGILSQSGGCASAGRLGNTKIRYDDVVRAPTPEDQSIPVYAERVDVPFEFLIIGEVHAAPMRMERDLGYTPIRIMTDSARKMGGIGLLTISSERGNWSAKVIVRK